MATETDFHRQNPRSVSFSEMLDHGSISFGRFASESLEWEKWSVFSHNRCQEELEKFMARGFVAQKKAYFEEYFKKIRAMKALEAEQQEASGPGLYKEELRSQITQVEAGNDAALLKEEKRSSYISPVHTLENDASADFDACLEGNEKKQRADSKEVLSNLSCKNATTDSLCATKPGQSRKHTPNARNSGNSHHNEILISNSVKQVTNKSKSQEHVASSGNMKKMGSRNKKDAVKSSTKTRPSQHDKIAFKAESSSNCSIVLGKSSTLKAANGNNSNHGLSHRKLTEASPDSAVWLTSLAKNRLKSSSGKTGQVKAKSNYRDSTDKFQRNVSHTLQPSRCFLTETGSGGLGQKRTDRNKLNGLGFSQRSCDSERKREEGDDESVTTIGRASRSVTITPSSNRKNLKLVQKNTTSQLTNLAHNRKLEARPKTPSWR